jgi:hypothetical protein
MRALEEREREKESHLLSVQSLFVRLALHLCLITTAGDGKKSRSQIDDDDDIGKRQEKER